MAVASILRRTASAPAHLVTRAIRSQTYHHGSALLSAVVCRSGLSRQASRSLFPLARHYSSLLSSDECTEEFDDQAEERRPLLIVAEDVESEALVTLILNKLRAGIKVCDIKAPGFGENRKANLQDLATLTGGEVISDELGMNLENVGPATFGTCKKVTISKEDTVILDGNGDKEAIEERCEQIGRASEAEVSVKKDRVTDALNVTKAVVGEGIVHGSRRYSTIAEPISPLITLDIERVQLASIMKTGVLQIAAIHDGKWKMGTAFFIDADGTFISCAHVPCTRVPGEEGEPDKFRVGKVVVLRVGGMFTRVFAEILAIDTHRDMFIGRIHREHVGKAHIFEFSNDLLPPGATVYGMGHAFNFAYAFRTGVMSDPLRRVMNFDTAHKERILLNPNDCPYEFFLSEVDMRFGRGCSGGPLINNWFKVVGILQSGMDGYTAMAIQSEHAIDFIKSWRCGSYDSLMINGEQIDLYSEPSGVFHLRP